MLRNLFLGFIRIHILYHASKEPIYGLEIIEELGRHGYKTSPGTIYPILHDLTEKGYLDCSPVNVEGKIRKYYSISESGRGVLQECRVKIRELAGEIYE
ncbi:MAG: PadR family transcriptional regulator [Firmicutes bacterium]|nr:PadR family transcriptional regulator [Bacillota bacterium]